MDIIDLPGIYSLSTFSLEEQVSREYIANERPEIVVNVVDACALERNLFFTLQLIELETPLVLALNQMDAAEKRGLRIDHQRLQEILGIPVVPMVATRGIGYSELLDKIVEVYEQNGENVPHPEYGREIEQAVGRLKKSIEEIDSKYPSRWLAIKLLEGDEEARRIVYSADPDIERRLEEVTLGLEILHGETPSAVVASERYTLANRIANQCMSIVTHPRQDFTERLDELLTDRIMGYPIMILVITAIFYGVFTFGDITSEALMVLFHELELILLGILGPGILFELLWGGIIEGIIAGITIALPYITPFYIVMALLEDSGYLARIAFLADAAMHKIGLHGKAFIPLILCYGCNVPGCLACRILETDRERLLAGFLTTLIPCAAVTVVIMGLVGTYVSLKWALGIYILDLIVVFILGRVAFKSLPGEPVGLIMEMPPLRSPTINVTAKKTWFRLQDFIYEAFPLIVLGNLMIRILMITDLLVVIEWLMRPITVQWLMLPAAVGITLIFGILRKELTLILLSSVLGTPNLASALTAEQMIVFATVTMFYIPCIATIAVLVKEFGYKRALTMTLFEILFSIILGGLLARALILF